MAEEVEEVAAEEAEAAVAEAAAEEEEEVEVHDTVVTWVKAPPAEVRAGAKMVLQVAVSCPIGCDLWGLPVTITGQDAVVADNVELAESDGTANETGEILVEAPLVPGQYTWLAVFPAEEEQGVLHREGSARCTFVVKPHAIGMAAWDLPSPAVVGTAFAVKVGVGCLDRCNLTGKQVEVYDHRGERLATAALREAPYSDKVDLHWAEVELQAPETEAYYQWQVRLPEPGLPIAHEEARHTFAFTAVRPGECKLAVEIVNQQTGAPIRNAWVILRPNLYRGCTDESGIATVRLAKGEYQLAVNARERAPVGIKYIWKHVDFSGNPRRTRCTTNGREFMVYVPEANKESRTPFKGSVKVEGDTTIRVELVGVIEPPEKDPF